jgi:hypothetical protein
VKLRKAQHSCSRTSSCRRTLLGAGWRRSVHLVLRPDGDRDTRLGHGNLRWLVRLSATRILGCLRSLALYPTTEVKS